MGRTFENKKIGEGNPVFIIAEAGVNHNGELKLAFQLIDAAVEAGADAVKFQTFITDENISNDTPLAGHHIENVGDGLSHFELIKKLELPFEYFKKLKDYCEEKSVLFISTPYDLRAAEYLIGIDVEIIKIASSELLNFPLLDLVGKSRTPVILSTGMSSWSEIHDSVEFLLKYHPEICILKCTSNYPAKPEDINLRGIHKLRDAFPDCILGFSDHSEGSEVSLASIGMGSSVIERHFTLNKNAWGPDHRASMTPDEFKKFVCKVRKVEKSMGNYDWDIQENEISQKQTMRKGVYVRRSIKRGRKVEIGDVKFMRPIGKMTPKDFYVNYLNQPLCIDILERSELTPEHFANKIK